MTDKIKADRCKAGRAAKEKGKRGERELAKVLTETLGLSHRRGQQYSGERGNPDVLADQEIGIHWECKRVERLRLGDAIRQAVNDCPHGRVPAVASRKFREGWLVTVRMEDLPALAAKVYKAIVHGGEGQ